MQLTTCHPYEIGLTFCGHPAYQGGNTVSLMSKSYFPTNRAGQIDWYNNFAKEFPKIGETLRFSQVEIANAVNDSRYAVYILETLGPEIEGNPSHAAHAVLEGQTSGEYVDLPAKSGAPPAVRPGIDTRRQARVERIKRHSAYNDAIGGQLKIASPKLNEKNYKAEVGQPRVTGNVVTVPFRKAGGAVNGINLYRQRKGENAPQLVGFFMRTPAVDGAATKSGQVTYTARAVINDREIGQPSEAVTVTVS
jgi:hypothetical protein